MAKENIRGDTPQKPPIRENEQLSDIILILDKMELMIQAVSKIGKDGKHETVPADKKHQNSFLKVDKYSSIVENFFKNFWSQLKYPTRFGIHIYNLTTDDINAELLEFLERIGMNNISEVMDANPDMLNIEGNRISFVEFDTDYSKWIVYLNTEADIKRERIEKILLSFFSYDWQENFKLQERSWSAFKHNCVAYRGSQGVHYEIWKYKPGYRNHTIPGSSPLKGQPIEVRNLKSIRSEKRAKQRPTPDL
jgi:hypothetical protein